MQSYRLLRKQIIPKQMELALIEISDFFVVVVPPCLSWCISDILFSSSSHHQIQPHNLGIHSVLTEMFYIIISEIEDSIS